MWPIWGRAVGQGIVCTIVVVEYGLHSTFVKKSQIRDVCWSLKHFKIV